MNTPPPAIPTEKFFVVVALFESPTTLIAPPSFAGLLMITKDATKALVTARGAEDGMKFKAGGYVAIYHTTLDRSLIEYDLHRIGEPAEHLSAAFFILQYQIIFLSPAPLLF
ncbi:MAG: hypothetical protein EB060_12715 [Proteobacteria bacterium]|nr:hypothetical protein [Pseudomonadota bacterium]